MKKLLHTFSWLFRASRNIIGKHKTYNMILVFLLLMGSGVGYYISHDRGIILPVTTVSTIVPSVEEKREAQLENNKAIVLEQIEAERPTEKSVQVKGGDTLVTLLIGEGVDSKVAHNVACSLKEHCDPRKLKPGQTVTLAMKPSEEDEKPELLKVSLKVDDAREVHASKNESNHFDVWMEEKELTKELALAKGVINGSFFTSGTSAGVPAMVVVEVIRALSHRVDLQRDIQPGDKFEIGFERFVDSNGKVIGEGKAMYASLVSGGKSTVLYRHTNKHGETDFYTHDGQHLKRGFMRTPVDGAKLTSNFGKRKDPFHHYTRMHRGVDFGAPQGTPVYASGEGVVVQLGWLGGYGRYIKIKHNQEYSTAYAHLHRFANGLKIGARVRQGQKIAEVGCTGRSTGPHLHYEVHRFGQQINPNSVKMVGGKKLEGRDLHYFKACNQNFEVQLAALRNDPVAGEKIVTAKLSDEMQKIQMAAAKAIAAKIPEALAEDVAEAAPKKLSIRAKPKSHNVRSKNKKTVKLKKRARRIRRA